MNEHDKLFKQIESVKENALDLIQSTFPAEVLATLNLATLELQKDSFIDKNLKEYFSDLVYSCQSSGSKPVKITLLFEHKSYRPDYEHLQLLGYMVNLWRNEEKNRVPLSLIIPMIFYHGEKAWEYRPFSDCFRQYDPVLYRFIPRFEYGLTDITGCSDKAIQSQLFKRSFNIAMSLLFKYIRNEKLLLEKATEIFESVKESFSNEAEKELLISMICYILKLSEIDPAALATKVNRLTPTGGETIMSTATRLRKEGKLEGKLEEKLEAARRMLEKKLDIDLIADVTGLPREEIEALSKEARQ